MKTSDTLKEFAPAYAKAQGAIDPAMKDRVNPQFKAKYADLTSVWDACRKAITDNGISVIQEVTTEEGGVSILTRLQHASGEYIELGPTTIPVLKRDAQGVGSAITYGKRYALSAALGVVADDDDDGNEASRGRARNQSQPEQPKREETQDPPKEPAKPLTEKQKQVRQLTVDWAKAFSVKKIEKAAFLKFVYGVLALDPARYSLDDAEAWDDDAIKMVREAITAPKEAA